MFFLSVVILEYFIVNILTYSSQIWNSNICAKVKCSYNCATLISIFSIGFKGWQSRIKDAAEKECGAQFLGSEAG